MLFSEVVSRRLKELKQIISEKEKNLQSAPDGWVEVHKRGKKTQYYHVKSGQKQGAYITIANFSLARKLAQKSYDQAVLEKAYHEKKILEALSLELKNGTVEDVYGRLSPFRQRLVDPILLPDSMYIENWENVEYEKKPFLDDAVCFYTSKGERVRSKSEVMIADALKKHKIPYRYEYPLQLGKTLVHPDFMVLNIHERKELYWEHLGMMDDYEYRENAIAKIKSYIFAGIFPGDKLIITMETRKQPLDSQYIQAVIKQYF